MPQVTFLLPPAARLGGQPLEPGMARALGRADSSQPPGAAGRKAQLLRHFELIPNHWPMAALTRQLDAGDATGACWLRADPAYVRPDINGVRLLACGAALVPTAEDSEALLPALRPLFGDAGFPLDAPTPARWYLRLPAEAKPPAFAEPDEALGSDLFEHLAEGAAGRRWRALANEAQVVLHNHPWNAKRVALGKPPINSLWFWGGGVLPDVVRTAHASVLADDAPLRALASATGEGVCQSLPHAFAVPAADSLVDLRDALDLAALQRDWLRPACDALLQRKLQCLSLDCGDGRGYVLRRGQRWRFWRRPMTRFAA